jgi:hypothetical protein
MKSFTEYLTESKKTYAFKLKFAGDLEEGFSDKLKSAMDRFAVVKLSSGKRTPVQEVPLDFPGLKNTNVTVFEVEVHYPTTPQVLEAYLSQVCCVTPSTVKVRTANEPSEIYQASMLEKDSDETALLNQDDLGGESARDSVNKKHISSFLKDLAKVKHAGEEYKGVNDAILASKVPSEKPSASSEASAGISPIGSKALKGK